MSDNTDQTKSGINMATLMGLGFAVIGILGGATIEGVHITALLQPTAAMIILGGTFGACFVQFPLAVAISSMKAIFGAFNEPKADNKSVIREIIRIAYKARKEGVISLEADAQKMSDQFMKKALMMAMDGVDPKVLRGTMELEIANIEEELGEPIEFWKSAGGYSPTIGIIGAIIGLIHVMDNLSDPSKLGAGIAVAFVATIYGLVLANIVCLPMSGKLKMRIKTQLVAKEIMLEGVISILEGENPRLIEDKLKSYLTYKEQQEYDESSARKS
jgi:chemotaxis protein MotA